MSIKQKFYRKNQKAKTYQKSNLQIQTHETLQEQQFIIENTTKTIDSPLKHMEHISRDS